jgi:hypothetical protein
MSQIPTGKQPTAEQEAEMAERSLKPAPAEPEVQAQFPLLTHCWRCGCVNNNNTQWSGFYCSWCGAANYN